MSHELTDRLVARTKALGLVAATALVTTALAGGGVVAVTVVGNDKPVPDAVTVPGEQRSDTATATIGDRPAKPDRPGVDAPECEAAETHGAFVSGVARGAAPGPSHGPLVSAAAKSDCGAPDGRSDGLGRSGAPGKSAVKGKPDEAGPREGRGRPDSPGRSGEG